MLTKSQLVFRKMDLTAEQYITAFVAFVSEVDEHFQTFDMTERDWRDMGCPNEITVTVEPGDVLNRETS